MKKQVWQNMLWTVPTVQVMMITAFAMVSVVDESLRKFFGAVGCLTSNKLLDFGGDPVHNLDPDFFKQFFYKGISFFGGGLHCPKCL